MLNRQFWLSLSLIIFSTMGFADQQTWHFVRHFEKQKTTDPSLTKIGKARAQALAVYFADKPLLEIYSTDYKRTKQTAAPVASLKVLPVQTYNPRNLVEFANQIANLNQVLVVGHSNTTPELLFLVGGQKVTMTELDYGTLYTVQKKDGVYTTQAQIISVP